MPRDHCERSQSLSVVGVENSRGPGGLGVSGSQSRTDGRCWNGGDDGR